MYSLCVWSFKKFWASWSESLDSPQSEELYKLGIQILLRPPTQHCGEVSLHLETNWTLKQPKRFKFSLVFALKLIQSGLRISKLHKICINSLRCPWWSCTINFKLFWWLWSKSCDLLQKPPERSDQAKVYAQVCTGFIDPTH